jgi:phage terminase large subunit-like protein
VARTKTRSTEPPPSGPGAACPIPLWAIAKLEEELGRSLEGWEAKEPLYHSPSPEASVADAWFDIAAVVHVVKALRRMPHTKGEWARTPFEPATWQIVWLLAPVFGWKYADGLRIVREIWDEIGRKNGKSAIGSRVGLVLAAADGEYGGEVYSAATSTEQAKQVFNESRMVAERSAALKRRADILTAVIRFPRTGSIFRVLSRIADAAHGLNVHGAVVDEVHLHKSKDLIEAIETGTGARRQPLILYITTAGDDDETTIYAEKHRDAIAIARGEVIDPSVWVVIWAAEKTDDPFDPVTWAKANPNYPISPSHAYLEKKAQKAQRTPTFLPTFLRLHLNIRTAFAGERWSGSDSWGTIGNAGMVPEEKLKGRKCWGGLVAATATDMTAVAWIFGNPEGKPGVWALWRYFLPRDQLFELDRRTNGIATVWASEGKLTLTEGNQIDVDAHVAQIRADCAIFDVRELAYDSGGAIGIVQPLMAAKLTTFIPMHANTPGSSLIDWERMVRAGEFNHGGNPITAWEISHLVVRETGGATWRIDRKGSPENVYGAVAAEIALRRYLVGAGGKSKILRGSM